MHIVHNIAFDVDVNHNNESISWEQYYVDFFQDKLLPKVERLCDTWEAKYPNTKCTIDTLDIDVTIDNTNLEELQNKIISQLEDQLLTIDKSGKTTNGSVRATITSVASPFDALVSYLSNGILPANISVKIFKEWLGNLIEFTNAEKITLRALFLSESATIERIISLLRNDHGKFSKMLETSQTINEQYVKLEETFFKKLLKECCEKLHLTYKEDQASIWFKTLGVNSSLTNFSKTLLQLLVPKAATEQKILVNINENQLSIAVLQAIIQHDLKLPLNITISKICNVVTNPNVETQTVKTVKNENIKTVKPEKNTQQTTTLESTSTNIADEQNLAETSQKAGNDQSILEKKTTVSDVQKDVSHNDEKSQNNLDKNKNIQNDATDEVSSIKKSTQEKAAKTATSNQEKTATQTNQKTTASTTNKVNAENEGSHSQRTHNKEVDKEEKAKTSNAIDKTIIEKIAKLNATTREISLTTEKAGLIILHPFLGTFFNGAKLVTADNKISDFGKASMLLHYLATENEEVTDVELTLEKILLGIPLGTIINYQTPLTEEDKAICDELLQAVMGHWKVLKNSTSNTLRDMFLKREGHIVLNETNSKLTIERFAQDVLLEKIPWNISLFQLKWMEKMMYIKW